ncbi:MAG: MerR family transcriptional regulator [Parvularculaceae bacterium]|nr:MerR family transcriptional regulator [Parvularculaceae bacterium]
MNKGEQLSIGEVVRRTGLTERTLRFYEQEGLIAPERSAAGQRLFRRKDLERVARIRVLKRVGFELGQIRKLLEGAAAPNADLVAGQIAMLKDEQQRVAAALAAIEPIKARLDGGETMSVDTLCTLIEAAECAANAEGWARAYDRYYSREEQMEWRALTTRAYADVDKETYFGSWDALARKILAALPLDPASRRAQKLLEEFETLTRPFAEVANPAQRAEAQRFWSKVGEWGGYVAVAWTQQCSDFIRDAKAAREANGKTAGDGA